MRQVAERLHDPLVFLGPQLIQHQGQDDGCGKTEQEFQSGNDDRVPEYVPEIITAEEAAEILQADPRAARDPLQELELLERQRYTVQGTVLEQQLPADYRQDHKQVQLMLLYPAQEGTPLLQSGRLHRSRHGRRLLSSR